MSSRPFFLLPLCFVSALALNVYAALDPTGVYQDYLEKLDAATPPVAAMATAAADGVYPWSEPKAPEPPPVLDFHVVFYGEAAFRHGAVKENSFAQPADHEVRT